MWGHGSLVQLIRQYLREQSREVLSGFNGGSLCAKRRVSYLNDDALLRIVGLRYPLCLLVTQEAIRKQRSCVWGRCRGIGRTSILVEIM